MLNAILCLWNEADIIFATVRHALTQGCEHVYIIDNGSTDETIREALRAGGTFYAKFHSDSFDETLKTLHINQAAISLNAVSPDAYNWWLYIDADEFPDFNTGKTIAETISAFPSDVRAVGGYLCEHLPTHAPYYITRAHPIDFMPVARMHGGKIWKFPLLRHNKDTPDIFSGSGAHRYMSGGENIRESEEKLLIHHFNHRKPDVTRRRLEALVLPDARGKRRVELHDLRATWNNMERSFYHNRLKHMTELYARNALLNLSEDALCYDYARAVRWYDAHALTLEDEHISVYDEHIWRGTHHYFLGDYASALPCFQDALSRADDPAHKDVLRLRISFCRRALGESVDV